MSQLRLSAAQRHRRRSSMSRGHAGPDRPGRARADHPARRRAADRRARDRRDLTAGRDDRAGPGGRDPGALSPAGDARGADPHRQPGAGRHAGIGWSGPGAGHAQRVVPGDAEGIEQQLCCAGWRSTSCSASSASSPGGSPGSRSAGFRRRSAAPPRRSAAASGRSCSPGRTRVSATVLRAGARLLPRDAHRDARKARSELTSAAASALAGAGAAGTAVLVALGALLPRGAHPASGRRWASAMAAPALRPGGGPDPARAGVRAGLIWSRRGKPASTHLAGTTPGLLGLIADEVRKAFKPDNRPGSRLMADISKVGVLGCGLMGSGIAQVAATAGFHTVVRDVGEPLLDKGRAGIRSRSTSLVEKGKLDPAGPRRRPRPARPSPPTWPRSGTATSSSKR